MIWAIQKHENSTVRRAELRYNVGFKQTSEEATKQKCNEILVKLAEEERRQQEEARRLITATRPLDSDESDLEEVRTGTCVKAARPIPNELTICEEEEGEERGEESGEERGEEVDQEQLGGKEGDRNEEDQETFESVMRMTVNSMVDTIEREQLSPVPSNSSESLVDLDLDL